MSAGFRFGLGFVGACGVCTLLFVSVILVSIWIGDHVRKHRRGRTGKMKVYGGPRSYRAVLQSNYIWPVLAAPLAEGEDRSGSSRTPSE